MQSQAPEIVTRTARTTLLSVPPSSIIVQPEVSNAAVSLAVAQAVALDTVEPHVIATIAPVVEAIVVQELDIREVAKSRVNMRMGPGTGFDVIATLNGGTKLEVLDVDADFWEHVSAVDRGIEGWIAERLLTDANT